MYRSFCSIRRFRAQQAIVKLHFSASARKGHNSKPIQKKCFIWPPAESTVEEGLSFLKNVVEQGINVRESQGKSLRPGPEGKVTP